MDTLSPLALLARTLATREPLAYRDGMEFLTCPYGHLLTPGDVDVGWSPCICPPAWEHHGGHQTLQCRACTRHNITSVRYVPEHVGGGHPNRQSRPGQPGGGGSRPEEPPVSAVTIDYRGHGD